MKYGKQHIDGSRSGGLQHAEPSDEACVRAFDMWWPGNDYSLSFKVSEVRPNPTRLAIARLIEQHLPLPRDPLLDLLEEAVGPHLMASAQDFAMIASDIRANRTAWLDALGEG